MVWTEQHLIRIFIAIVLGSTKSRIIEKDWLRFRLLDSNFIEWSLSQETV